MGKDSFYIGMRSFLSSFVRWIVFATQRIILVVVSCEIEGGREIVVVVVTVFVDDVDEGCRDLLGDFGVITWRTGEKRWSRM